MQAFMDATQKTLLGKIYLGGFPGIEDLGSLLGSYSNEKKGPKVELKDTLVNLLCGSSLKLKEIKQVITKVQENKEKFLSHLVSLNPF